MKAKTNLELERSYPFLGLYVDEVNPSFVVLFTKPSHGMVVDPMTNPERYIGFTSNTWDMGSFTRMKSGSTVTLTA